jgi:uncharacterized protein YggE
MLKNTQQMKNILIAFSILISFPISAQIGEKNFIDQNYIEVIGQAEKEIAPDEIYLKILINEKDVKGKTLSETEGLMFEKLQQIGIDISKDLAIKDLVSNFHYYWIIKTDILLVKEYQLLVHDAKTAGKVFVELQKLGISNISIDRLDNSKIDDFRRQVKINAIKSAQEKARDLTLAVNQDIGRAIYIMEHENNINMTRALQGKTAGVLIRGLPNSNIYGSRASEPDIEFEKIKLEYYVTVRFELK